MLHIQLTPTRPERLATFALVVLGLLAYANCLSSEFVFDDLLFINGRTLDFRSSNWLAPQLDLPIKGRPLVGLSFVANYRLCGSQPSGYHLFNMLVHLSCALVLFATIRRATRWLDRASDDARATGLAFACAALWMIHPLQTECVNYVSQRTESMSALFVLTAFYCALRSWEQPNRWRWIIAAGAASWAGAFCKEVAAIGPVLILLFDLSFASRPVSEVVRDRWRVYVATFSNWIPLAVLLGCFPRTVTVGAGSSAKVIEYVLNQAVLLFQYLRLAFWPDALVIDYGRPASVAWSEWLLPAMVIASLLLLTAVSYRRCRVAGYLGLSSFLLLAPTSSFLPISSEVGAERRMYLPLAAIVLLVVLGVRDLVRRCAAGYRRHSNTAFNMRPSKARWAGASAGMQRVLLAVVLVLLAVRTVIRNQDYAQPIKLWTQAVAANPDNPRAWSWLACESSRVNPAAAQRVTFEMALRWHDNSSVQFDVAETYLRLHGNAPAAARCYRRVIELDPSHVRAQLRLVWLLAAHAEDDLRDGDEALEIASRLQTQYPSSPETLDALAIAQAECGDFEAAIATTMAAITAGGAQGDLAASLRQRLECYRERHPFRFRQT